MFAHVNGTTLHYLMHGSGPPVMVLHGGLGLDHSYLRPWLDALGESNTLLFVDLRGNGQSERPADWRTVCHATFVRDIDALREHLGYRRMSLFGHSYGAFLAQEYALAYPMRLMALALCSAAPVVDYSDTIRSNAIARAVPEMLSAFEHMFSSPMADDSELARVFETLLPLYFHRFDPNVARYIMSKIRFSAAASNHALAACLPTFNVLPRLPEIAMPALLLAGRRDWLAPPEYGAQRIQSRVEKATLHVFENSGHFPFIEANDEFLAVVRSFLREHCRR